MNLIRMKGVSYSRARYKQQHRLLQGKISHIIQKSQSQYLINNKEIDFIIAPFSAESQLIQMFEQQLISLLFVSPDSVRKYLRQSRTDKINSSILCATNLKRQPSESKQYEAQFFQIQEVSQDKNRSNQSFIQELYKDLQCSSIKFQSPYNSFSIVQSKLSQFAIFCISVGLIRPSIGTIFQTHTLNFWNKSFRISEEQFLLGLIASRYSKLFTYAQKVFFNINKFHPLQDFFYIRHANQQYKKYSNQNVQQMNEMIKVNRCQNSQANKGKQTILQILSGFQKQMSMQSNQQVIQSCRDLISQLNCKSTLDLIYVLKYINPKQKNSLLYEKLLIETEIQMSNPQSKFDGGAITIFLLELLHFGYLSDLNLDNNQKDQIRIEPEITLNKKNIVFITRIFCISHYFFPKSKIIKSKYLDSDLMKYCYLLQQLKENLETVRQVTFCTTFYQCLKNGNIGLDLNYQETIDQIKLLEDSLIKSLEVNSQVGLVMKILIVQYNEQHQQTPKDKISKLKTEFNLEFDQELKTSIKFVYQNVWKRLTILFKKLRNHTKLSDSYLSLIQNSDKFLKQFLQHKTILQ